MQQREYGNTGEKLSIIGFAGFPPVLLEVIRKVPTLVKVAPPSVEMSMRNSV